MRWHFALLAFVVTVVLVGGYSIFQKIPKPEYANRGEPVPCGEVPEFSSYPSGEAYTGTIPSINWDSNTKARELEPEILAATASGVNFASQYVLLSTSCGSNCLSYTAIHAQNGNIALHGLQSRGPIQTRIDSRLVIVNPDSGQQGPTLYYDFNSALHYICETQG